MIYRNAILGFAVVVGTAWGQQSALPPDSPSQLTLPAGTWVSVRTEQVLSSDHNRPGDAFTATLAQPLVANGFVVARRGQIISGRVADAAKGAA